MRHDSIQDTTSFLFFFFPGRTCFVFYCMCSTPDLWKQESQCGVNTPHHHGPEAITPTKRSQITTLGKLFNLWSLSFSICNGKGNGLWVLTSQSLPEDAPTSLIRTALARRVTVLWKPCMRLWRGHCLRRKYCSYFGNSLESGAEFKSQLYT